MALNLSALKGGGSPTSQDAPTLNLSAFGQKPQATAPSDAPMKALGLDFSSFGNKGSTPGLSPVQFQAPAQVRVPFGTNKQTVPAAQGLTAMAEDTVSRLLEVIPKTVIQFAQNVKPMYDAAHEFSAKPLLAGSDGEKPLSLPFNAQRLGFADGLESTGKATWDTFLGLESSNTSGNMGIAVKNAAIATISHVVPDTLNAIIAGDEITGAAKQALKLTYFDPELDSALQQMQLQRGFSYGEFKGNFTRIGTELAQAGDSQGLNDLARAASTIGQRMASGGSGIGFQISKLGQAVQNVARTLTTPIEDFGMEAGQRPLGTPQGQLPGFRPAGGGKPIPNVGLGIQPEESVGGAPEITPPEKGSFAIPKTSEEATNNFYEQKVKPAMDSGQAIVIGADDIKDLHGGDYNPANHPIYSKAANDLFTKSVKESTNPVVKIIVGGTGSGKSDFAVPDLSKNFNGVIYDSTGWNYEGLKKQIAIAKAAGKTVEIYGLVPPDLAKTKAYTLLREQAGGHPVSNESFNRTHAGAVQTLLQAAKDGADVRLGDLTDPQNFKWNPVNVADLQGKAYNEKEIQQKVNYVNTTNAKEIAGGNSILRGGNEGGLGISEKDGSIHAGNAEETRGAVPEEARQRWEEIGKQIEESEKEIQILTRGPKDFEQGGKATSKVAQASTQRLTNLYKKVDALKTEGQTLREKYPEISSGKHTFTEKQLLTERMRTLARGARMAASGTKEEIAKAQSELVDIINKSDLDLNDKGKFLATVKNIQTLDQFNKAMPEIEERIAKLDEAATKRSLLAEIKGELGEKLYTGKGDARIGKYSPSVMRKLQSFKEELSFKDPASLKMKQLEITQNWIAEHPDEPMSNSVIESLDELQRTHLKLLTNAELEEQLQSIQNLKTQGKTFKELKLNQIARDRGETIRQFKDDITGGKGVAERGPVIESQKQKGLIARWAEQAKEFLYTRQLISDNIFDILDEKAGTKLYAGRIHDKFINLNSTARDARISGTSDALHKIQPLLEKVKKDLMKTVDLGDGIKLTRNEMIDVYMRSHDPAQLESMIEGNKIPLSKIKEIKGSLTPDEIAVAEAALAHWDQNYDSMNRVFREKHFFDMPRNVGYGYSPMPKDMQFVADEDVNLVKQQMDYAKASVPKGMTKLRSGSLAPVRLGFVQNFVDGVTRAEHYKAFELPIQEMNAILNGIKEAVTQEHGLDYYKLIRDYVKKSANQGKYDTSYLSKALLKLRSSASSGILGLNLVTSVKHMLASIGGALTELNEKEFGIGIFNYFKNKKIWDAFWDKVPQFAERSSSATRELQEVTTTKGPLNTALGKSSLKEKFMTPLRVGDKLAVRSEATAVYLREVKNGASKEQAIQSAVSKLRRTQTGGSPEDLSSLMTGGSMEKMLTMFATEQNKYLNLMYGYSRAYAKGRIPFSKFARALFYTWIFNGLAMEEARKGGKVTPSDLAEALFLGPFENVLVLGGIIESVRTGYQYEASPVFGMLNSMKTYLGDIKNGKAIQGLEGLGETVGTVAGAPVAPVKRIGTGAYNLLTGKTNDWRQLIWSASALGETKTAPRASGTGLGVLPKLPQLPRLPALPKIGR